MSDTDNNTDSPDGGQPSGTTEGGAKLSDRVAASRDNSGKHYDPSREADAKAWAENSAKRESELGKTMQQELVR